MKVKGIQIIAVATVLLLVAGGLMAQEERKVKMDEYKVQLADVQTREATAAEKTAVLEAEIAELNGQIEGVQAEIDAEWEAIYALLGTDKAGVEAFVADLDAMDAELDGLSALSAEELYEQKADIKAMKTKLAEMKESNIAMIGYVGEKIAALEAKLGAVCEKMPANPYDQYEVVKGDHLWKIAKKDEIYGDAYQWIRIYGDNKDQIKDPDVISPEQVLNIYRGVGDDQYIVVKGDWLSKIAENKMGDPTKWTKIYEANKDAVLTDANVIYPHQVLVVPQD